MDKRSFSPCSFRSFLFHTHTHTLSLFYHQLSLFSLVLHLVFNFRSTLRPYARFSAFSPFSFVHLFSPPFSPILNPVPLLLPDRLGKRKIHCVLHSLLSLSLSHCIHTPTLSLPLTYLISLEHEIRNVVFSFFFLHRRKRIRKVAVIAKGKFNERRRLSSRNPVLLSPSLPRRIFPKTVDEKNPFSLPFLFLFFSILTNKRISLISSCESQCIVFFLFFLKNQSIYGMIRHLTGLPCKALERRGLRIYAERHARRVQLFRYKFVHFL